MLTAEARIDTDRPSRFLVQFCKHAAAMGSAGGHRPRVHLGGPLARREVQVQAEWSAAAGTVTFTPWGTCTMRAAANTLTVRVEAADEENLRQIQDVVTRDLDRFSRRDPLTVTWQRPDPPGVPADPAASRGAPSPPRPLPARRGPLGRRGPLSRRAIVLALAVALAVAVHLGLGATVLANSRWTLGAAAVVLAIVALKVVLVVLGVRHHQSATAHGGGVAAGDAAAER
ncbi:MAG TPA: DUF2218 domain-containing protein [Mycobacteriales bacterium]|nr:DUF2218 domain-containing protein [Mycobacteriales bacterium]